MMYLGHVLFQFVLPLEPFTAIRAMKFSVRMKMIDATFVRVDACDNVSDSAITKKRSLPVIGVF